LKLLQGAASNTLSKHKKTISDGNEQEDAWRCSDDCVGSSSSDLPGLSGVDDKGLGGCYDVYYMRRRERNDWIQCDAVKIRPVGVLWSGPGA
jgi:hypothetical protein